MNVFDVEFLFRLDKDCSQHLAMRLDNLLPADLLAGVRDVTENRVDMVDSDIYSATRRATYDCSVLMEGRKTFG